MDTTNPLCPQERAPSGLARRGAKCFNDTWLGGTGCLQPVFLRLE